MVFWAFHHEPVTQIRISFDYFRWGRESDAFHLSLRSLCDALVDKLGAPAKRSNRRGKGHLDWVQGKRRLLLTEAKEGVWIVVT